MERKATRISLYVADEGLHRRLRMVAAALGVKSSRLVEDALRLHLDKLDGGPAAPISAPMRTGSSTFPSRFDLNRERKAVTDTRPSGGGWNSCTKCKPTCVEDVCACGCHRD